MMTKINDVLIEEASITFTKPYHKIEYSFKKLDALHATTYLNHVAGNFAVHFKVETASNLKVYYPNGWFDLTLNKNKQHHFCIELHIYDKTLIEGKQTLQLLENIHQQLLIYSNN